MSATQPVGPDDWVIHRLQSFSFLDTVFRIYGMRQNIGSLFRPELSTVENIGYRHIAIDFQKRTDFADGVYPPLG
jgi:hypothetical protein